MGSQTFLMEGCLTDRRINYLTKLKMDYKTSEHFVLQEFINPADFEQHKEDSIDLIDKKLIDIAEFIRIDTEKPVTINNWHTGGQYKESGLREANTTTGAPKSAHKVGKAIDVKIAGWNGMHWYEYVKKNAKQLYQLGVRRIEDKKIATTWCHIDTKEHGEPNVITIIDLTKVTERIKIVGL